MTLTGVRIYACVESYIYIYIYIYINSHKNIYIHMYTYISIIYIYIYQTSQFAIDTTAYSSCPDQWFVIYLFVHTF